jgi:hypothetical protein
MPSLHLVQLNESIVIPALHAWALATISPWQGCRASFITDQEDVGRSSNSSNGFSRPSPPVHITERFESRDFLARTK